ncbi:TPA: hypothetical protein JIS17_12345 [Acinetobacter baumannii]|nr:hypothetical protein [Acinetobacter baumannii]HAV4579080.1 hypothetical protein [Acinetobacter baumannii]
MKPEQFIRDFEVKKANAKAQMCRDEKNHAINRWSAVCKERDELQKRIDDSIFILSTIDNPDEAYNAIDLLLRVLRGEQALKGEGQ